jgi:hypothetical protein
MLNVELIFVSLRIECADRMKAERCQYFKTCPTVNSKIITLAAMNAMFKMAGEFRISDYFGSRDTVPSE